MDRRHGGLGGRGHGGLSLSSDEALAREKAREAERAAYRRRYWQTYARRTKRVFGVLSPEDHADVQARAEKHDRSVWGQIWAESVAYRRGQVLPTPEIEAHQRRLIAELRRIGNNLNQLAKLGHIQAMRGGGVAAPDGDRLGTEALRQMGALEDAVALFAAIPFKQRRISCCRICGRETGSHFRCKCLNVDDEDNADDR